MRNLDVFKLSLQIIEQSKQTEYISYFKELMMANKANPVLFYRDFGFNWLHHLPIAAASMQVIKYLLFVLNDLQTKCKEYII